jgi:hypothetical protein
VPASLPSAPDLLAIIREFLETDIMPDANLGEDKRFNIRIAINILATAERELRLGPAADGAEADRLSALVGADGSIEEKNRRLAHAIREKMVAGNDPLVLDHLHQTMVDALRINNPKWLPKGQKQIRSSGDRVTGSSVVSDRP